VGFRVSRDLGKTWQETPHTPAKPLFGESGMWGHPVKIGAPHFVDFGKDMEHSPDGKAYLVAQGAELTDPKPRFANLSWITADQVYLARVRPSPETINDLKAWEFFGGIFKVLIVDNTKAIVHTADPLAPRIVDAVRRLLGGGVRSLRRSPRVAPFYGDVPLFLRIPRAADR